MTTTRTRIVRFQTPDELTRAVAADFFSAIDKSERLSVALAGGRIYSNVYASMAQEARKHPGALDKVEFFWSDERCVPPGDPESNFRMANTEFLSKVSLAADRIHRLRGEEPPERAVAGAEAELRALVPGDPVPVLDLVFLGMGHDGHVASLFPGQDEPPGKSAFRYVVGNKQPPQRLTMSYLALAAAREVWVVISGAEKLGALRSSLAPGSPTPLARVIASRSKTVILTDCQV